MIRRGGDDDRIKGRVFFPAEVTVTLFEMNLGIAQIAQPVCGLFSQFRHNLDAVHFNGSQFRQHRRLVA